MRDHLEDLPELVDRLFAKLGEGLHFSASAMQALEHYSWPGNVRELANAVEHTLMQVEKVQKVEEFEIRKRDPRGWVVIRRAFPKLQRTLL